MQIGSVIEDCVVVVEKKRNSLVRLRLPPAQPRCTADYNHRQVYQIFLDRSNNCEREI